MVDENCVTSATATPQLGDSSIVFDRTLRTRMERAFRADFSQVELVVGDLPRRHGAHALTCGKRIHFAPGSWAPSTPAGIALLAHELTHVVQQANGCIPCEARADELWIDATLEAEAEHVANLAASGHEHRIAGFLLAVAGSHATGVAPRVALQPQLVIEGTGVYIAMAQNALGMLTAQLPNAFVFTAIDEGTHVTPGVQWAAAMGQRPLAGAVIDRIMASGHWVTIRNGGNGATPAMWTKDKIWSTVRGVGGFMAKVTTPGRGASSTLTWDGGAHRCSDYDPLQGHIVMEIVPSHIMLAHELIHGDRISRGTYNTGGARTSFVIDTRHPPVFKDYSDRGWRYEANAATWVGGIGGAWVADDQVATDDIANCGFHDRDGATGADPLLVTENMIRGENAINPRSKYGNFSIRLTAPRV